MVDNVDMKFVAASISNLQLMVNEDSGVNATI